MPESPTRPLADSTATTSISGPPPSQIPQQAESLLSNTSLNVPSPQITSKSTTQAAIKNLDKRLQTSANSLPSLAASSHISAVGGLQQSTLFTHNGSLFKPPSPDKSHSRKSPAVNKTLLIARLTVQLCELYKTCDPEFKYTVAKNPRRVLTKPSEPAHNDGHDNEHNDYILYVNDLLGDKEGQKYLILDILGQGTFGQVVKCRNLKSNQLVAVKVIKNKKAYFNQSMMEVTVLEMLNNRYDQHDNHNIARLLDTFIYRKHLCLVFELLSVNLYELIRQNNFRGLSANLVRIFTKQIIDSLCVLNDARIVHCDLKPENILLKNLDSPTIKVIDFGSACHEQQTMYTYIQSRFYRSPEVLLGLPYSSSIDMWSLGCITAELFLGLPIFPGSSEYNQVCRIVEMFGMPPAYMLEFGKNAKNFFNKMHTEDGKRYWTLKSLEQYNAEKNANEKPSKRYFQATTLRDLVMSHKNSKAVNGELSEKERMQRECLLDFIHGLLEMNPLERWSPHQARMHPFITGDRFTGPFQLSLRLPLAPGSAARHHLHAETEAIKALSGIRSESDELPIHRRARANTISSAKFARVPRQLQAIIPADPNTKQFSPSIAHRRMSRWHSMDNLPSNFGTSQQQNHQQQQQQLRPNAAAELYQNNQSTHIPPQVQLLSEQFIGVSISSGNNPLIPPTINTNIPMMVLPHQISAISPANNQRLGLISPTLQRQSSSPVTHTLPNLANSNRSDIYGGGNNASFSPRSSSGRRDSLYGRSLAHSRRESVSTSSLSNIKEHEVQDNFSGGVEQIVSGSQPDIINPAGTPNAPYPYHDRPSLQPGMPPPASTYILPRRLSAPAIYVPEQLLSHRQHPPHAMPYNMFVQQQAHPRPWAHNPYVVSHQPNYIQPQQQQSQQELNPQMHIDISDSNSLHQQQQQLWYSPGGSAYSPMDSSSSPVRALPTLGYAPSFPLFHSGPVLQPAFPSPTINQPPALIPPFEQQFAQYSLNQQQYAPQPVHQAQFPQSSQPSISTAGGGSDVNSTTTDGRRKQNEDSKQRINPRQDPSIS